LAKINTEAFMLVLSSPSGAGKTTLAKALINNSQNLVTSISVTTRAMRPKEQEGVDYFFIDKNRYEQMIQNDELLEHANVFEQYYGTPKDYVFKHLANGRDVLFDIDWQGAAQLVKKHALQVVSVYILPPSMQELQKRLNKRADESVENINKRMAKAHLEISHWHSYDYIIVNYDIEQSLKQLSAILCAERLKKARQVGMKDFVDNLIKG
jgi:guanylate kinase